MAESASCLAAAVVAFLVSLAATWVVLQVTTRWQLLDRPSARSSHRLPTPTGGGLGIIVGVWSGVVLLAAWGAETGPLLGGGLLAWGASTLVLLALTVDDLVRPLRVTEKFLLLCLAAGVWLALGPRLEVVTLPAVGRVGLGPWSWPLTALWLLSVSNAYNFMDGIDGITSVQTLCVSGFLLLALSHVGVGWSVVGLIAASSAGFLVLNRPPARIFMGDVGSTFIGFTLAALAVVAEPAGVPLWLVVVFLGYYAFDTGYTLLRRAWRGENVVEAHRKHLYQRLYRRGWPAGHIDLLILGTNVILSSGGYLCAFAAGPWGAALVVAGIALLAAQAVWVERRDPGFV